jgi:thioredoxin 1
MADKSIVHITDDTFESEVLQSPTPVLVDYWAEWCGPCKMIAPVLDELASEMQGKAKFVKMNVDENPQVAGQYGIMSIPTLIVFKDGKPVNKMVGGQPKPQLKAFIESAL